MQTLFFFGMLLSGLGSQTAGEESQPRVVILYGEDYVVPFDTFEIIQNSESDRDRARSFLRLANIEYTNAVVYSCGLDEREQAIADLQSELRGIGLTLPGPDYEPWNVEPQLCLRSDNFFSHTIVRAQTYIRSARYELGIE